MARYTEEQNQEMFALPKTAAGIRARIDLLKEECDIIEAQLNSAQKRAEFRDGNEYQKWRNKAQAAYGWKRQECTWCAAWKTLTTRR